MRRRHAGHARARLTVVAGLVAAVVGLTAGAALAAPSQPSTHARLSVTHSVRVASGTEVTFSTKGTGLGPHQHLVSWSLNFGDHSVQTKGRSTLSSSVRHTYVKPGTYTATLALTDTHKHRFVRTLKVHTSDAALGATLTAVTPSIAVPAGSGADLAYVAETDVTFTTTLTGHPLRNAFVGFFVNGKLIRHSRGKVVQFFSKPGIYRVAAAADDPAGPAPTKTWIVDVVPAVSVSAPATWTAGRPETVTVTDYEPVGVTKGFESVFVMPDSLPSNISSSYRLISTSGAVSQYSVSASASGAAHVYASVDTSSPRFSMGGQAITVVPTTATTLSATSGTTQSDGDPTVVSLANTDPRPITSWALTETTSSGAVSLANASGTFPSAGADVRFTTPGTHVVKASIFFSDSAQLVLTTTVDVVGPPAVDPDATFPGTDQVDIGTASGTTVTLSGDARARDYLVNWDVASDPDWDLVTSVPGAVPASLPHTYSAPGTYTVGLEVDDDHGGYDVEEFDVTVS